MAKATCPNCGHEFTTGGTKLNPYREAVLNLMHNAEEPVLAEQVADVLRHDFTDYDGKTSFKRLIKGYLDRLVKEGKLHKDKYRRYSLSVERPGE